MRAVVFDQPGGSEVLRIGEVDKPEPKPGEVRIRVAATAVNRADISQRQGSYPPPPGASPILGLECSGRIEAVGEGVEGWQVGQRVMTILTGGGYAEHVATPAGPLLPIPDEVDLVTAGGLAEVFLTAHSNLFGLAALAPGETVLIHGGASGVGTAAIQLVKQLHGGASKVIVTVGREEKAEACRELGADHAILYKEEDFAERVKALTDGRGVDAVLDHIGADYLARNLASLAPYGRLVIIGLLGGAKAEINLGALMVKRQKVIGSVLRARSVEEKTEIARAFERDAYPCFTDGRIRPVIHDRLPLDEVKAAHDMVERDENTGKVLLVVDPDA